MQTTTLPQHTSPLTWRGCLSKERVFHIPIILPAENSLQSASSGSCLFVLCLLSHVLQGLWAEQPFYKHSLHIRMPVLVLHI